MLLPYFDSDMIEAGIDEAGRGCLAGEVFAAAVILPKNFKDPILNDSKQLTAHQRYDLRKKIEDKALAFSVQTGTLEEIDSINILQANYNAMHRCIDSLSLKPEMLLVDGNSFRPYFGISHQCIVKGDGKFMSIAAASILAKTYRDEYMDQIDIEFPQYLWRKNKGYATIEHRKAMLKYGPCIYHRKNFVCKNLDILKG